MKQAFLLLIPLLAACGRGGDDSGRSRSGPSVQTAELTGLYEAAGEDGQKGQMCVVPEAPGTFSFALVTEAQGGGCGGAGDAVLEGNLLRLNMTGDEECAIEAQVDGTRVTLPASLPEGCAYYCAPGATLSGQSFEKTGGTVEDAMRATDPAGDPLCG